MNLDNQANFNLAVKAALNIGLLHTAFNQPRVKSKELVSLVQDQIGRFGYRNFHVEILNRAYGLAFTNAKKMKWVRKMEAARVNPQSV